MKFLSNFFQKVRGVWGEAPNKHLNLMKFFRRYDKMGRWFRKHKQKIGIVVAVLLVILLAAGSLAGVVPALLS